MRRIALLLCFIAAQAWAQSNLEVDSPAIHAIKDAMAERFGQLEPLFSTGAVGLTRDGRIELRDANLVPLAGRAQASGLIAAENRDRAALYREIAAANGHPEWEAEVRNTFAQRWIDKARTGWFVRDAGGGWTKK